MDNDIHISPNITIAAQQLSDQRQRISDHPGLTPYAKEWRIR